MKRLNLIVFASRLNKQGELLTDGLQNSLAASLEINTWVRSQDVPCHIIHGDEAHVVAELGMAEKAYARRNLLAGKRIGVVGEPSEWLIASGVDPEGHQVVDNCCQSIISSKWDLL